VKKDMQILKEIGEIDDSSVAEAEVRRKSRFTPARLTAVAAGLALAVAIGALVPRLAGNHGGGVVGPNVDPPVTDVGTDTTDVGTQTEPPETTNTPVVTEPDPPETKGPMGGGEEGVCPLHDINAYHSIPGSLIDKVGEENFQAWLDSLPDDYDKDGCTDACNIVDFLIYFNFTPEEIEEFVYKEEYYSLPGDIDALLRGDYESFEKSFRIGNYSEKFAEQLSSERALKIFILEYLRDSGNQEWIDLYNELTQNGKRYDVDTWSIPEIVYKTDLTQAELEAILEDLQYNEFLNCSVNTFNYDFSPIYSEEGLHKEIDELYPVLVDKLLRR